MMKKTFGCLLSVAAALYAQNAQADLYQECLDKNYMSDKEMAKCSDDEATRIMGEIRKKINSIAATSYFNNWAPSRKQYNELLDNWDKFRSQYCDLLGYTYTQGMGTISILQTATCNVDMNNRLLQDIENVITVYKENAN